MKDLADSAIQSDPSLSLRARAELQAKLRYDALNADYFLSLYASYKNPVEKEALQIYEDGKSYDGHQITYPTAAAPASLIEELPYVNYEDIAASKGNYRSRAKNVLLWVRKMQAGSGSTMTRSTYLARIRNVPLEKVSIGAKGTDLYLNTPLGQISLAEAQILQSIRDAESGFFAEVALHDLISSETESSIAAIWSKSSAFNQAKTYAEYVSEHKNVRRFGRTFQSLIPTIDEDKEISQRRMAPGGHALFALDALRAAYIDELRPVPRQAGTVVISSIGNGEDLSSTPDADMVGWMVAEKIPIAMITTDKTEIDLKGGQIALVKRADGFVFVTIVEQAQAKQAGQQKLFEELGLRQGDKTAFFNTNVALFNYEILTPKIKALIKEIGEREFLKIVTPELIQNRKSQVDDDGVTRSYIQLEGAMGSSLLKLDRYWRERFGEPLVHFINVSRANRTRFFSPIKTAFDFFMQFHSDRFVVDFDEMRLVNKRPGSLPSVALSDKRSSDKYWADVENVLNNFRGAKIINLDSLEVEGKFDFRNLELKGNIRVKDGKIV